MTTILWLCLLPCMTQPVVVPPAERPSLNLELSVMAALQAADVITTRIAISKGSAEGNPLMRPFTGSTVKLALVKSGVTVLIIAMSKLAAKYGHGKDMKIALWLSNAMMAIVIGNNVADIRRLNRLHGR